MSDTPTPRRRFAVHRRRVVETAFDPANYRFAEGVLALANGYMGQRASFEEGAAGAEGLRGHYVAGVFDAYPNPTMIRLKGRPEQPGEIVNVPDFLPIAVRLNGEPLDLSRRRPQQYERTLDMDRGVLTRRVVVDLPSCAAAEVTFTRFLSLARPHVAAARVTVRALSGAVDVEFISAVDGGVRNERAEHLADARPCRAPDGAWHGVRCRTRTSGIELAVLAAEAVDGQAVTESPQAEGAVTRRAVRRRCGQGQAVTFEKLVAVATSRDADLQGSPARDAEARLREAAAAGAEALLREHEAAWAELWRTADINVRQADGSEELTQGLTYALYQMLANAPRGGAGVQIGAKGLTGEHYFGTYFWDTEAFMLPMFVFVLPAVARDLVRFRIRTLDAARAKAAEMGLAGAAYPFMADADGRESCTLWQFALLGVHVTADVAWGVWLYVCATGDLDILAEGGIDVMVETARFWVSRASPRGADRYDILRVLGPDEYHQAVDNNFYTNAMARENLQNASSLLEALRAERPADHAAAVARLGLTDAEVERFAHVAERLHLPRDERLGVNMQDDWFALLQPHDLAAHPPGGPLNACWSYDRILRTQLLRQADVLVAHVLIGDRFGGEQARRDFDYYEPKTTHDSSLSFCTHCIVAAALGRAGKAYDYFLRTARLDLDDLHGNSWQGIHAANLAGAWQCVVLGFGGLRWYGGRLSLDPLLPAAWEGYTFTVWWRGVRVRVSVGEGRVELRTDGGRVALRLGGREVEAGAEPASFPHPTRRGE